MKVKHYNEMMAYLIRPGFNGGGSVSNNTVLPKRKPAAEVKKRKKINYEKIKQYLGKESQDLIERELGFAVGGGVSPNQLKQRFMELIISIQDAEAEEVPRLVAEAKGIKDKIDELNKVLAPERQIKITAEGLDFDNPLLDAAKIQESVKPIQTTPNAIKSITTENPALIAVPDFPKGDKGTLADPEEKEDVFERDPSRKIATRPDGTVTKASMQMKRPTNLSDMIRDVLKKFDKEEYPEIKTEDSFADGGRIGFEPGGNVDLSRGTPSITDNEDFQKKVKKLRSDKKTVGQIAKDLKVSVGTVERTINKVGDSGKRTKDVVAQEKLKQAYDSFVKNTGKVPRIQDMRDAGLSQEAIAKAQRDGIEFGRKGEGKGSAKAKIVNDDLIAMSKNNKIKKALADGIIPNVQDVIKVTSATDEASALNRLVQLSDEILSNRKDLNLKLDKYKSSAKLIFDNADVLNSQIREIAEKEIGASVGEQSIKNPRKDIVRQNIMPGYNIDEPGGVMSSYRRGSKPYAIFSQAIGADLNQGDKLSFDVFKSIKEKEIQMAKGNERVKKINEFNQGVTKYEKLLNADRKPGELKVKLFRASMKNPSKTVARFSQLPKDYQTAFTNTYNKLGYSFEVPKDIKTIFEMREDIKKPAVAAKVAERIKTGPPRVLSSFGVIPDSKALTAFGKAGQIAKIAAKGEVFIAPIFLAGGAMYGLPFSRNINEATYGLLGDSKNEFLIKQNPDAEIFLNIMKEDEKFRTLLENYNNASPATRLQFKDKMEAKRNEFNKKVEAFRALPKDQIIKSQQAAERVTLQYENLIKENRENRFQYGVIPKKQLFIDIADTFKSMAPSKPVENVLGVQIPTGQMQTEFAGGGIAKEAGDESGKPPESGPTPQGLASIIKRGRKY
jgi:hypothetical protein